MVGNKRIGVLAILGGLVALSAAELRGGEKRVDKFGDPLPAGATLRIGTNRLSSNGQLNNLVLSPDGKVLATYYNSHIRLFDVESGKVLRILEQEQAGLGGLAFSPDGKLLASAGGWNGSGRPVTIYLWNPHTGKLLNRLEGHKESLLALAFSSDSKILASHARDKMTMLWDVVTGKMNQKFEDYHDGSASLSFAPDGKALATTGHDGTIRIWNLATGKTSAKLAPNRFSLAKVLFAPDGEQVITAGGQDGLIRWWHVGQAREIKNIVGHKGGVLALALSKDGKTLVSGGSDGAVRFWDRESGNLLFQHQASTKEIRYVALSPDGLTLATGSFPSARPQVWRLVKQPDGTTALREMFPVDGHDGFVASLAVSRDGKRILSTGSDQTVRLWEFDTGKELHRFNGGSLPRAAFSPDGSLMAYLDVNANLGRWTFLVDTATGKLLSKIKNPAQFNSLTFSPDNRTLVCGSYDKNIYLIELATGQPRGSLPTGAKSQDHVILSPDGLTLASADYDDIHLWDLISGKELASWPAPQSYSTLAFSPAGTTLAGRTFKDMTVRFWDLSGKELLAIPLQVHHLAFVPEGSVLATAGSKRPVEFWNVATGKQMHDLPLKHGFYGGPLAFAPDGRTLLTGDGNSILLWSTADFFKGEPAAAVPLSQKERAARLAQVPARPWGDDWFDLAGPDAQKAYQALWGMVAKGEETEKRMAEQVMQILVIPIADRIADLGHDNVKRRNGAEQDLQRLGTLAKPALRVALDRDLNPAARRWIERYFALRESGQVKGPDEGLRLLRAIEVLEHLATPRARELLRQLAKDAPSPVREAAQTTLTRMTPTTARKE